eukprot:112975-Amorphochlora_amoeboformis.AAC.2
MHVVITFSSSISFVPLFFLPRDARPDPRLGLLPVPEFDRDDRRVEPTDLADALLDELRVVRWDAGLRGIRLDFLGC